MMDYQWNINNCTILVDEAEESFAIFRNNYYNPAFNIDTKVTTEIVTEWLDKYMDRVVIYGDEPNLSIFDPRIEEDMDEFDYDDEGFSNQSIHDNITELVQSKKDIVEIFNDTSLDMLSKITKLGEMQEELNGKIEEFVENVVNNPMVDTNITENMSPDLITTQNVSKWLDEIIQDKIQDNPQNNFFNYYLENNFSTSIAESVLDEEPRTSNNTSIEESSMSEANSVLDNEESSVPMSSDEEPSTPTSSFDNEEIDI